MQYVILNENLRSFPFDKLPKAMEEAEKEYGQRLKMILNNLYQINDLRVLDYNSHHIFKKFTFPDMGPPYYES